MRSRAASGPATSFCAPTTKMTLAAPQAYEASWLPEAEAMTRAPSRGDGVDAAEGVVGLAGDRLHLRQLGCEVERQHPVARRIVRAAIVDRIRDPGLLQRDRSVGHHGGARGHACENGFACRVEVVDHLDAEAVLLERDDRRGERLVVRQRGEAVGCVCRAHLRTSGDGFETKSVPPGAAVSHPPVASPRRLSPKDSLVGIANPR